MMKHILTLFCFLFSFNFVDAQRTFLNTYEEGVLLTEGRNIIKTDDNGFLVLGNTFGVSTVIDFCVIKIDENGNEVWRFVLDFDLGSFMDICIDAAELNNHYAVLVFTRELLNTTQELPHILYLDKENGALYQNTPLHEFHYSTFYEIETTIDNNLVLFGNAKVQDDISNPQGAAIVKVEPYKEPLWIRFLDDAAGFYFTNLFDERFHMYGMKADALGNYYLASGDGYPAEENTFIITKVDSTGNVLWTDRKENSLQATSVALQSDGVLATSNQIDSLNSVLLKKSLLGEDLWMNSYDLYMEKIVASASDSNDNIFLVGYEHEDSHFDMKLLKLTPKGDVLWDKGLGSLFADSISRYIPRSLVCTSDGGVAITGILHVVDTHFNSGGIFVLRLNSDGELGDIVSTQRPIFPRIAVEVYPNPATDYITIQNKNTTNLSDYKVTLYDVQGVAHYTGRLEGLQMTIPIRQLAKGTYIIELHNDMHRWQKKIIKQ